MDRSPAQRPESRFADGHGLFLVPRDTAQRPPALPLQERMDEEARWTTTHLVIAALAGPLFWVAHVVLERVLHV